jgi:hypothetical protein
VWRYHLIRGLRRAHRDGELRYIGRYAKRAALAEFRMTYYDA